MDGWHNLSYRVWESLVLLLTRLVYYIEGKTGDFNLLYRYLIVFNVAHCSGVETMDFWSVISLKFFFNCSDHDRIFEKKRGKSNRVTRRHQLHDRMHLIVLYSCLIRCICLDHQRNSRVYGNNHTVRYIFFEISKSFDCCRRKQKIIGGKRKTDGCIFCKKEVILEITLKHAHSLF